jgi:hypothetical protein
MQIDRSNYEIWITDWLDGNLSDIQIELVEQFLFANPDLYEEFEDLQPLILNPPSKSFFLKEGLKKSAADIPSSQFDYLCIASLENDLSPYQQAEMTEIIGGDPEKQRSYELLKKIRLVPSSDIYRNRNKLLKRTPLQIVYRLSVTVAAVAATVALIILTTIIIPSNHQNNGNIIAHNTIGDSALSEPSTSDVPVKEIQGKKPAIIKQNDKIRIVKVEKKNSFFKQPDMISLLPADSIQREPGSPEISFAKIPACTEIILKKDNTSNALIASGYSFTSSAYDEERSKLGRFISRTFREKILKEPSFSDSPLKVYEIAEAGVTGLNKLLGWEMALDERKDENGELRSVYFNSKILKFNAPVKKTEPLQ